MPAGTNGQLNNAKAIAHKERQALALKLRLQGKTFTEIAKIIGRATPTTHKMVKAAIKDIIQEPAEEVRIMELERLDKLFERAFAKAAPEDKPNKASIDYAELCLKIMDRRAKMLGLDKPAKIALTDPTGDKPMDPVQFYIPSNGRDTPKPETQDATTADPAG